MKILWVATKPPWPLVDGGRLLTATTLEALHARGLEIDLVAPCDATASGADEIRRRLQHVCRPHLVPVERRSIVASVLVALRTGRPLAIARHAHAALRARVAELLEAHAIDVVHAEQLHALAQCAPALERRIPVLLRCQNVESDLWHGWARGGMGLRVLATPEASRLARYEGRALREAATVVALTAPDAARLAALAAGTVTVEHVAAPFPAVLPPGAALGTDGPHVVVLGSAGWRPNRDGMTWFRDAVWPHVRAALPGATLHLFGAGTGDAPRVLVRPAPADSRDAFPADAIVAVPLRLASGVRMRILEAWARGLPVVATPQAVRGLDARDGRELLVAATAAQFVAALRRLDQDRAARAALVAAGRDRLRSSHDPAAIATRLEELYRAAADAGVGNAALRPR